MSHVSDPYVMIGMMHDSIRVQMVSISMPPGNRGIFPKAAHARTINAMMHFLGFPERVVADDRRHKYEASGCGSHT